MRAIRQFLMPLIAAVAALWTYSSQTAEAHREAITRHPVDAVLTQNSPVLPPKATGARVWVAWNDPGGRHHTAMATVPRNLGRSQKPGKRLKIWIDNRSGEPATPPITTADAVLRAFVIAGMTFVGLLIGRHTGRAGLHILIARREASLIDAEWESAAPTWTRRHI